MGLTNNQKKLIDFIAANNMRMAKEAALACIAEDTTSKNRLWCSGAEARLKSEPAEIEVPPNLAGIIRIEKSDFFRIDRYYAAERECEIVNSILRMKEVTAVMAEMGIPYLNATLLCGESGTGKTLFGRYIAYKLGLPFCYVDFSGLIDSLMGNTGKNLNRVFSFASQFPCVLMLDELDCIGTMRDNTASRSADAEIARATIQLIQEMNNAPSSMVLLGATNRLDRIDDAIARRFKVHKVQPLSEEEKHSLLVRYNNTTGNLFSDEELRSIAAKETNQSYAVREFIEKLAQKIMET